MNFDMARKMSSDAVDTVITNDEEDSGLRVVPLLRAGAEA